MVQVKMFSSEDFDLEEEMNAWLARHFSIEIVQVTQSQCAALSEPTGECEERVLTNLTITIWYRDRRES